MTLKDVVGRLTREAFDPDEIEAAKRAGATLGRVAEAIKPGNILWAWKRRKVTVLPPRS